MKTCRNCGTQNSDENLFCLECGARLEKSSDPTCVSERPRTASITPETPIVNVDAAAEAITDIADKTKRGAIDIAGKINTTVSTALEHQKAKANDEARKEIARAQKRKTTTSMSGASGTQFMSDTELWSWLQKGSKRQHFYTEEESLLTQDEYMDLLANKLSDNDVPATVRKRHIQWDRSNVDQDVCFVQPLSEAVNPLSCLIQFNHVGKFTFVEEKTFITPPDLPEVPQKKANIPSDLVDTTGWLPIGCLIAAGSLLLFLINAMLAFVGILIGGGVALTGYNAKQKLEALRKHNKKCDEQERKWDTAWSNWENSIFLHSFQENVNGQISRIYDAVFECVKQLNGELFSQQECSEDSENRSMNELEELINRRKEVYR